MLNDFTTGIGYNNSNSVNNQLDEVKENFVHSFMRGIMGIVSDNQAQRIEPVLIHELGKVEVVDPYRTYDEYRENDFEQLIDLFIKSKRVSGLSERSLEFYKSTLLNLMKSTGLTSITDYTSSVIHDYLELKIEESSKVTADNYRRNLSSFFNWCQKQEHILRNPMDKIDAIKQPKKVKKPYTDEELDKLRNTCKKRIDDASYDKTLYKYKSAIRGLAILELLLSSGIRVGELCGIHLSDINFTDLTVKVLGKGNKERETLFNTRARTAIDNYLKAREEFFDSPRSMDWWLFSSDDELNVQLKVNGVERRLREAGRDCGIPKVHPHRFRRTFATTLVNHDMPIELVQQLLGHNSITTTMIYVNLDKTRVRASYDKILNG